MPFKPYKGEVTQDENTVKTPSFKPYKGEIIADEAPAEPSFLGKVKDQIVESGSAALNPIGKGLELANQIPYVQDVIPDFLATTGTAQEGIAKGGYNAARNTLQLGADIQDYLIPGASTPMSDMLSVVPKAKYDGMAEGVAGGITEIASGFLIGNKMGALAKTSQLGDDAVRVATKIAPEATHKLIKFATDLIRGGSQGVIGTGVTTEPGTTNVVIGKTALVTKLGIGPLTEGLPTDSLDAAENALAARINTAIDGFITGAGVTAAFQGISALNKVLVAPVIYDKLSPLWSQTARIKTFFEQVGEEFKKLPNGDSPEGLDAFHKRAAELAGNGDAGVLKKDLGIPGVAPIEEGLDTATTVSRQISKKGAEQMDIDIKNTLEAQAKSIGMKGYEKTAGRREAPTQALARALDQTEDALGGTATAQSGAREVQRLGDEVVAQGKSEKQLAEVEMTNTLGTAQPISKVTTPTKEPTSIIESVHHAKDVRRAEVNDLFEAIPKDAKYDGVSINKIIADRPEAMPDEIIDLLKSKESDGSFAYLQKTIRPQVSKMIRSLEDAAGPLLPSQRAELKALRSLRDNIDKDQIKFLKDSGRSDVVTARNKAMAAYEEDIAKNRQGVVGELDDIRNKNNLNIEDTFSESRKALKKAIDADVLEPESNKRLYDVLSSNEGGQNTELLERYKGARDKAKELEDIESEVYGNKLREFYSQYDNSPTPVGVKAFEDLLEDPQGVNRINEMVELAKKDGTPAVQKALEYTYARSLKKKLFTGHQTELGNPTTNAPGVQGVLNNESFIKTGEKIFKDNPDFMVAVKDTLELAHDIQKATYKRGAPSGPAGQIVERAKQALKTGMSPFVGPLSHTGYVTNNWFRALLEVLGPQGAVDRLADTLLHNGQEYARAYVRLKNIKESKKAETLVKVLTASVLRTNGDREKFNKKFKQISTESQTNEALKK